MDKQWIMVILGVVIDVNLKLAELAVDFHVNSGSYPRVMPGRL